MKQKAKSTNTNKQKSCNYYLHLFIFTAVCFSCELGKAQTEPVNIRQAIDIAMANNYGLQADSLNMTVTVYQNKQTSG